MLEQRHVAAIDAADAQFIEQARQARLSNCGMPAVGAAVDPAVVAPALRSAVL